MSQLAASLGPSTYWYLARATGVVAVLLLTASVVLGILGPLRISSGPRWPRFAVDMMHRDVSLLVMVLLVLHIVTSVLDGFAPIAWVDAVIPFGSGYRPLWMALGALSFDLLVALVITSLVRVRLGYRWWRSIHWLAYVSWPIAVLHGLGTGSDVKSWWMLLVTVACVAVVVVAVLVRIARSRPAQPAVRTWSTFLAVATPIGLAIFTLAGPLAPGWARRAGTPARLLPHSTVPVSIRSPVSTSGSNSSSPLARPFTSSLSGSVSQSQQAAGAIIELSLRLRGRVTGSLRVRLGGTPLSGGGLSLTGSQVDLSAVGAPAALDGRVVSLQGSRFLARVADASGHGVQLTAALNIDSGGNTVTGSVSGQPFGAGK
ncbi:MAG TPA: ferric reductase-like transmembrane domain-containing protein [Solirubrobacteraceae bacterium]|nr:ferric reductase-like transmembrane domain-containing protein [Solirubrobacteraceae bacterium]